MLIIAPPEMGQDAACLETSLEIHGKFLSFSGIFSCGFPLF